MEKIPSDRKGVVFGLMTDEEKKCLMNSSGTLIYFSNGQWFKSKVKKLELCKSPNAAYWIKEWDGARDDDCVGKWCWVWDEGQEKGNTIARIHRTVNGTWFNYQTEDGIFYTFASPLTLEDLEKVRMEVMK